MGQTTLKGIHFLLTYICNYECDHCFLYCSPRSTGTFTLKKMRNILGEAQKISSVEWIFFEGGEPFLFYPLMVEGARLAKEKGFKLGIVTNSYWATTVEDAELWLEPFVDIGIDDLSISNDLFHYGNEEKNLAKNAEIAAHNLNLATSSICIENPELQISLENEHEKGTPIIGGGTMFRGRAIEKLTEGLPTQSWMNLTTCPHEDLEKLGRVHIDAFGNTQICQGLSIGNACNTPLSELINNYEVSKHPICGPLFRGGPAELSKEFNVPSETSYVDECHYCFLVRKKLINKFPQFIGPRQIYGLE
ncbi:MAG: radical SAM protein [Candidatus Thorarchaeota archaeon]